MVLFFVVIVRLVCCVILSMVCWVVVGVVWLLKIMGIELGMIILFFVINLVVNDGLSMGWIFLLEFYCNMLYLWNELSVMY